MKKYVFKPYSKIYPELFNKEKERIASHIEQTLRIEHIGSSAIPGLGGKGIIDIAIAANKWDFDSISSQLQVLGYVFSPSWSTADRFYFKIDLPDPEEGQRRYHIHLMSHDSTELSDMLSFRNYLIKYPEEASKYADLKKKAAEEADENGTRYRELKKPLIEEIVKKSKI